MYEVKKAARINFVEEALASWAEYQTTGQHLTGEEVQKWLTCWGTAEEAEIPACHG